MYSVMNDTKWLELQAGMINLEVCSPQFRVSNIENDYISNWDGEWYYHFSDGGFKDIKWVELKIVSELQMKEVHKVLKAINLPGCLTENGFKIFGYVNNGQAVNYI